MAPGALLSLGPDELTRRAAGIAWLLLDVDGCLTDGRLLYGPDGEVTLSFDIKDGLAISLARHVGIKVGILSGRGNQALRERARELSVHALILDRSDKGPAFAEFLAEHGVGPEAVAAIGDDVQDLPVLDRAGLSFAPADAAPEVQEAVDLVLTRPGGRGAVREMVERLLRARGEWDALVTRIRRGS